MDMLGYLNLNLLLPGQFVFLLESLNILIVYTPDLFQCYDSMEEQFQCSASMLHLELSFKLIRNSFKIILHI